MKKQENKRRNRVEAFDKQFFLVLIPLILLMILFLFFPYWFTTRSWFGVDFSKTGQIGDTIGGILGPFIAIAAAILTFLAFWVQFKANEQQKKDLQIERFENKFYNLMEIHRNNVHEVIIGETTKGRRAFISMFKELKFTYLIITEYYNEDYIKRHPDHLISDEGIYNISYLVFYFGVGANSSKVVIDLIGKEHLVFFREVEEFVKLNKEQWKEKRVAGHTISANFGDSPYELDINYMPCNGHMSILSHYMRNLYHTVKYIDEQDEDLIPYEQKLQYASTLRSQLSIHEQLLVYYNAISVLGKTWIDDGLLAKYCIIKNLPIPLADFYRSPLALFPEKNSFDKTMFEWTELHTRVELLH
ncbi:MAG: putative phage abortive infection protein [Bacteroidota bacterium]|jgi:hypothetical protein|nr:putative phage abortive infection protein [Bacteroidota bacterium]